MLLQPEERTDRNDMKNSFQNTKIQPSYTSVSCVIMASGLGKRFGENKLMADFHGQPMISHALTVTEGFFARRITVTRHREVADFCRQKEIPVLLHDLPYRNDTVRLGLEYLESLESQSSQKSSIVSSDLIQGCLFCPGDQPLLRRETISALIAAARNEPEKIWRVSCKGEAGTPVLFPRWTFPELKTLPMGKGGGYLAKKYPEQVRMIPVRDWYELKDVDTRKDLNILSALFFK